MNLLRAFLHLLALLAVAAFAHAENITVRNKTIHQPAPIYVAEYSCGASKCERVKGPYLIYTDDEKTWEKSPSKAFHTRGLRWSSKESDLKSEFTQNQWDSVGGVIGKTTISSGFQTCNISDRYGAGVYESKTDTGEWLGSGWTGAWEYVWGPLSTAGTNITVTNETEKTCWLGEYQKKPWGVATRLQGPWQLNPGQSTTFKRAKLGPGYTERHIRWGDSAANIASSFDHSFFEGLNGRQASGAGYKRIHLFFDKDGLPEGYSDLLWKSKEYFKCKLLVDAIGVAAAAGQYVKIPEALGAVIGLDALLQPIQNAAANAVNLQSLQASLNERVTPLFPDSSIQKISTARSFLGNPVFAGKLAEVFKSDCFCSSDKADHIKKTITGIGMKVAAWPVAQTGGHFFQGYTMTMGVQYKAATISISQSMLTDYGSNTKALFSFGIAGGTSVAKTPSISRSYSLEFYPCIEVPTVMEAGWNFGVSGPLPGPLVGGGGALFGTNGQVPYLPVLTKLVGLSFPASAKSATSTFAASGGVGWTWSAW